MSALWAGCARDPGLEAAPVDLGDLAEFGATATVRGTIRSSGVGRDAGRTIMIEKIGPASVVMIASMHLNPTLAERVGAAQMQAVAGFAAGLVHCVSDQVRGLLEV